MQIMVKEEEKERERERQRKRQESWTFESYDSKLTKRTLRHKRISNACVSNANVIDSTAIHIHRVAKTWV